MKLEEFREKYPNILECIEIISTDNNMPMLEEFEVPLFLTATLEIFEIQAQHLSDEEKEIIAMGDDEERDELIKRTGLSYFDDFLTEVFEGRLSDIFWDAPLYSG